MTRTASILHLAYSNAAGVPGRWAAAHRKAGVRAGLLLELPDEYEYGDRATVDRWSDQSVLKAVAVQIIEDADVVMVYDSPFYLEIALELGKTVLFRALGAHSRRESERVRELLQSPLVRRATAGTADLAIALDVPFVGAPFPLLAQATKERHVATHSPSNRLLKGTDAIVEIAQKAGWKVDVVDGVSHTEVLERKRTSRLVIDQFGSPPHPDGLGVSAVEAMAMGLPVVGRVTSDVWLMYRDVGCPAVFVSTEAVLLDELNRLHDPEERRRLGEEGRAWVRSFHDGAARAREDLAALEIA